MVRYDAKQYKNLKGLTKENLRDYMPTLELVLIDQVAAKKLKTQQMNFPAKNKQYSPPMYLQASLICFRKCSYFPNEKDPLSFVTQWMASFSLCSFDVFGRCLKMYSYNRRAGIT